MPLSEAPIKWMMKPGVQNSRPLMTWPSGVQCQDVSNQITLLAVSGDLLTSLTTSITISISVVSTMQTTLGTTQQQFWWRLFNVTIRQFIWFIALCPHGGESISHQHMIQCFFGWGRVRIAALSHLLDAFPHVWSVFSSSTMLNQAIQGFLPWFRRLQQGCYVQLLVWWLSKRDIDHRCNPSTTDATVGSFISLSQPLISSLYMRSNGLYIIFRWHCSQIVCGGSWATQLTYMVEICVTCRSFNSMLEVIVAATYWNLMNVFTGCLNFVMGVVQACV